MRAFVPILALVVVALPAPALGGTIKELALEQGRTDTNTLATPVFDGAGVGSVYFETIVSRASSEKMVRKLPGAKGFGAPKGDLGSGVDLGGLMTEALRDESAAMGLTVASDPGEAAWTVSGSIESALVQSRPKAFGVILFYTSLDVSLTVRDAAGSTVELPLGCHNMHTRVNVGFGTKDEGADVLAALLIESGQEIVTRLNRDHFHAPPHPSIAEAVQRVTSSGVEGAEQDVLRIGLSGAGEHAPALLGLLDRLTDEHERSAVVNALANLGSTDAAAPLATIYPQEEHEDSRYFILKAMAYLGGEQASEVIARGAKDEDPACRDLAARLAG